MTRKRSYVASVVAAVVILAGGARLSEARELPSAGMRDECSDAQIDYLLDDARTTCAGRGGACIWDVECSAHGIVWSLQCGSESGPCAAM
jgi:hypothetical protein